MGRASELVDFNRNTEHLLDKFSCQRDSALYVRVEGVILLIGEAYAQPCGGGDELRLILVVSLPDLLKSGMSVSKIKLINRSADDCSAVQERF